MTEESPMTLLEAMEHLAQCQEEMLAAMDRTNEAATRVLAILAIEAIEKGQRQ